ncbi:hypothetical protein BU23DRAFT_571363 [Bimuria novae-zelandiae CBS 107.79]|uniref:Fungal N-terminal domain-containing protein n=1 Tax=Bimuria novae-zelandiae CBS 107.79 TaxID=1447943 RepID=A0A6A5UYB0_9PLEO|nr:hypothetical protein BU23DRAFT_571363 [Bimuria novae-zelandiae CBS 107.79]
MSTPPLQRGQSTLALIAHLSAHLTHLHTLLVRATDTYHESLTTLFSSDRETAKLSLRGITEEVKETIATLLELGGKVSVVDAAEIYVVAGYGKDEALGKANEDLDGFKERVRRVEEAVGGMVARVVYG